MVVPARVRVRIARPADAFDLQRWRAEESVRRYQPLTDASVDDLRNDVAGQNTADLARGRGDRFQWIVEVGGSSAGWITLAIQSWPHGLAEIGYALSTPYQGCGVMPVALSKVLAQLFSDTPLFRIEARCHVDNRPSQRVLTRLGFSCEGRLRQYFSLGGSRVDNLLYALLRAELQLVSDV